jgi:hypothetical protein
MKDILEAGTWTCSQFHKDINGEVIPVILCKDILDRDKSYLFLFKDRATVHNVNKMKYQDNKSTWILKRI